MSKTRALIALTILTALTLVPAASAQRTQKPVLHGRHWVAVTGKPLGATAGAMVFTRGGNAVEATCAMLAATCTMWDTLGWGGETQALLYAWRRAADYDRTRAAVTSWLVLIVRSRCLDRLRSHQRMDAMLTVVERETPSTEGPKSYSKVLERERARRLHDALSRLPEAQREVLEHCFFDGLTQREVAERTGIPIGTVKTRTLLAMQKLRRELGAERSHLV